MTYKRDLYTTAHNSKYCLIILLLIICVRSCVYLQAAWWVKLTSARRRMNVETVYEFPAETRHPMAMTAADVSCHPSSPGCGHLIADTGINRPRRSPASRQLDVCDNLPAVSITPHIALRPGMRCCKRQPASYRRSGAGDSNTRSCENVYHST